MFRTALQRRIKGIIFDLDGTLYLYREEKKAVFMRAAARAARLAGVPADEEQLVAMLRGQRHSHVLVPDWIRDHGMRLDVFHHAFHDLVGPDQVAVPFPGLVEAMGDLTLPRMILTHASRGWAVRMLAHLGLASFFPVESIIALEDMGFQGKDVSPQPFLRAAEMLGAPPSSVLVVEDTPKNLILARQLGMHTCLIACDAAPDPLPPFIGSCYSSPVEMIRSGLLAPPAPCAPAPCATAPRLRQGVGSAKVSPV